jgi:arsenate reductase
VADPAAVEGSHAMRMLAFRQAFAVLERRVKTLVELRGALDRKVLKAKVDEIGRIGNNVEDHRS